MNDLKVQIIAILNPPEGVVYPLMHKEDLLLDLFKKWALEMVGEDERWENSNGNVSWEDEEQKASNKRADQIRERIEESTK